MKIHINSTTSELLQILESEYTSSYPEASVLVMGKSDCDYFIQMCNEEGGGIDAEMEEFFKNRPIGKNVSFSDLLGFVNKVQRLPRFTSLDGRIVIEYGLHIWISGYYIAHNPFKSKTHVREMTLIDKIFHPVKEV